MKKTISFILSLVLCFAFLVPARAEKPLKIVATVFPIYDWTREIAGDNAEITMLLDSGVDLHSFQPTAQDILKIADCDVFIYVGGESDQWVDATVASAGNPNLIIINLLEALGDRAREEETVEGMESEAEEDGEESEAEMDEHIWLSLRNAKILTGTIADALAAADADSADAYRERAAAYGEKLDALDQAYREATEGAAVRTLLFGDRFPFRYLAEDYGLNYYAAFAGCSAETEASFETIMFLAGKVDELGLKTILKVEKTDGRIAETIVASTRTKDQQIVTMNAMQTITAQDVQDGACYLTIMEQNLEALKEAVQ